MIYNFHEGTYHEQFVSIVRVSRKIFRLRPKSTCQKSKSNSQAEKDDEEGNVGA